MRGLAALLVVWLHVAEIFVRVPEIKAHGTAFYDIIRYVDLGRLGVSIFFAISGFVICTSIKGEKRSGSRVFLIRRFFRLYPAFWVSVILGTLVIWNWQGRPIEPSTILANFTMIPAVFGEKLIMGLYWTLEQELLFYLLVTVLFWLGILQRPLVIFTLSIFALALFSFFIVFPQYGPEYPPWITAPYNLALMWWGSLFRYWYDNKHRKVIWGSLKFNILILLGLNTGFLLLVAGVGLTYSLAFDQFVFLNDSTAYLLAILIFIAGILYFPIRDRRIVWLGTISYSIYLFHPVVFAALRKGLASIDNRLLTFHLSFYIIGTMLLTVGIAAVIYYLVEKPSINLSYRLTKK